MRMESPLNQRLRRSPPDVVYTPIDVTSNRLRRPADLRIRAVMVDQEVNRYTRSTFLMRTPAGGVATGTVSPRPIRSCPVDAAEDTIISSFNVRLERRGQVRTLLHEIIDQLMPGLSRTLDCVRGQGRWPDMEQVAGWWGMRVFDGMSVADIVEEVSQKRDSDESERLRTALSRLRMADPDP